MTCIACLHVLMMISSYHPAMSTPWMTQMLGQCMGNCMKLQSTVCYSATTISDFGVWRARLSSSCQRQFRFQISTASLSPYFCCVCLDMVPTTKPPNFPRHRKIVFIIIYPCTWVFNRIYIIVYIYIHIRKLKHSYAFRLTGLLCLLPISTAQWFPANCKMAFFPRNWSFLSTP